MRRLSRTTAAWAALFAAAGALLVVRNLSDLDSAPPGLYNDEASIGYNAWAIADHGVDEHGATMPLFFEAFGEYKNPVYVYTLALLLKVFPLTVAVERLPAALFGMASVIFITLAAWQLTRSRLITFTTLALAALTPWLTIESRVGFEVISMVAFISAAVWLLLVAEQRRSRRWFLAAGAAFGIAIFGYSTARLEVGLFVAAFAAMQWFGKRAQRTPGWWAVLIGPALGYVVMGIWSLIHPGALTARYDLLSITAGNPSAATVVRTFVGNWLSYFSPNFLLTQGDSNPRHNFQYGGMLLAAGVAVALIGAVGVLRRRDRTERWLLWCLLLAPVAAALTVLGDTAHALRGSVMLPFLLALGAIGMRDIVRWTAGHRRALQLTAALIGAGIAVQGSLLTIDSYTHYPALSSPAFDDGSLQAISYAHSVADGHTVIVSSSLDQPYVQVAFALTPAPPAAHDSNSAAGEMTEAGVQLMEPPFDSADVSSGDILILSAFPGDADHPPPGAQLLTVELTPPDNARLGETRYAQEPLVAVYRIP